MGAMYYFSFLTSLLVIFKLEKDAQEACQWLKFTGFSRYAKAYEGITLSNSIICYYYL